MEPIPVARAAAGPRPLRAIVALFLVTVTWGWTFVWMKQGLNAAGAKLGTGAGVLATAWFLALRFGLATLCFLPIARARRADGRAWSGGLVLGGLLLGGFVLQMLGLAEHDLTPGVSAFLTSLYVLFTALATAFLHGRNPRLAIWVGVFLALAGAFFIRGRPEIDFRRGEVLTVACAVLFAAHILATDRVTRRSAPLAVTFTSFVVVTAGAALLGAVALAGEPGIGARDLLELALVPEFARPLILSSVFATVLALTLMNVYQRELDPVRAAILYAIEPIWAALIGIAAGTDEPTSWLWIGGALLVAGNLVAELGARDRNSVPGAARPGPETSRRAESG